MQGGAETEERVEDQVTPGALLTPKPHRLYREDRTRCQKRFILLSYWLLMVSLLK